MKKKNIIVLLSGTLLLTLLFMLPYLSNDLSLEHDTLFHLSRIEGLAQSFKSENCFLMYIHSKMMVLDMPVLCSTAIFFWFLLHFCILRDLKWPLDGK